MINTPQKSHNTCHNAKQFLVNSNWSSNMDKQPSICLNPSVSVSALMILIDFTLSNARRFYSSMGNPSDTEGLMSKQSIEKLNSRKSIPGNESQQLNIFLLKKNVSPVMTLLSLQRLWLQKQLRLTPEKPVVGC